MTFIPKNRKANYAKAKAYIVLLDFMLKTMQKFVEEERRFGGYVPYININLPRNQGSPLNPHCTT